MHVLFYQYRVLPGKSNKLRGKIVGALATVMVFADSDDVGRARCGRFISQNDWKLKSLSKSCSWGLSRLRI